MPMNRVQFQAGLSMPEFLELYGTEAKCQAALQAVTTADQGPPAQPQGRRTWKTRASLADIGLDGRSLGGNVSSARRTPPTSSSAQARSRSMKASLPWPDRAYSPFGPGGIVDGVQGVHGTERSGVALR